MNSQEVTWLQQATQGNDEAFACLVETYQTPVYNLCYRMLGNPQEAEDAAQECFWRAYQSLKRYDPNRPFATWLLSIAAHYCIDQHRRRRLPSFDLDDMAEEMIPDHTPDPETAAVTSERDRLLHNLLNDLNAQDRAAVILRYWYDLSELEISQALSLSVSAVKSRLHRARRTLAERWQEAQPAALHSERNTYETQSF